MLNYLITTLILGSYIFTYYQTESIQREIKELTKELYEVKLQLVKLNGKLTSKTSS